MVLNMLIVDYNSAVSPKVKHKNFFLRKVSGVNFYVAFSFRRLAISASSIRSFPNL